jgi:glycogen(starch) synthase
MKMAHVFATTDAVGGVWTYALELAQGASARGIETTLAVLGPSPSEAQVAQSAGIRGLRLIDTGLPLDWTAESSATIAAAAVRLGELAGLSGADLIHLNSPAFATRRPFRKPVVGVLHSCLATWWRAVRSGPLPEDFAWRTSLLREGMVACDAIITPSGAYADSVAETYGLERPYVVHNGRSAAPRAPETRKPVVVTAGRLWDPGKNATVLDALAARLKAPILAIGPLTGPNGEQAVLRHARHIGPLGADEVRDIFAGAAIFVSAARYEPFGLAVLEAAQAGCALVLADIPTFRELWDGMARFADPDDPAAFAGIIQGLLDSPDDARKLGEAARQRANLLTAEAMTRGVLNVYRRVAPDFAQAEGAAA